MPLKSPLLQAAADIGLAKNIVRELMPVLGGDLPEPELKVVNQPRAGWLGRDTWRIGIQNGKPFWNDNTRIDLQRSILNDENTLRRILAHELAHHADALTHGIEEMRKVTDVWTFKSFSRGQVGTGHGKTWRQIAQKFNAKYGADFVTEKSDETYVKEETELRPYHILLKRDYDGTVAYEVSSRISPKMQRMLDRMANDKEGTEYRLAQTNDRDFFEGHLIGSWYWIHAKEPEKQKKLEVLWERGQRVVPTGAAKEQDELLAKMRQYDWLNKGKKSSLKLAWKEIEMSEKDEEGEEQANLLGGILENDKDLAEWAEKDMAYPTMTEMPKRRRFMAQFKGKRVAVIDDMRAFARGEGYGTKLMTQFIAKAEAAGCDAIFLEAGVHEIQDEGFDLVKWYERLGFKKLMVVGKLPLMVKWLKPQGKKASDEIKIAKATAKHATTQINLPEEMAWKLRQLVKKLIPEEDLAGDGYEKNIHITCKYGVEETEQKMIEAVGDQAAFPIKFGKTHVFEPSDSSDGTAPVVILIEAPELHELHKKIDAAIGMKKDDFPYQPHATLAYVKPELAEKYEGLTFIEGVEFQATNITISKKDRIMITVDFGKLRKTAADDTGTAITMAADVEGFPPVVVVRFPKGTRWRTVLRIVKQIAGEIAGRRVPWKDIMVFENPWSGYREQQEKFPEWAARGNQTMYDIMEDGTFQSVGKPVTPPPPPPPEPKKRPRTTYLKEDPDNPLNPRTKEELDDFLKNRKPDEYFGEFYRRTKLGAMHTAERITRENDAWKCICGNQPHSDGFYPCDTDGTVVEPTEADWDGNLWVCTACGRIVDGRALRVVGQKRENLFTKDYTGFDDAKTGSEEVRVDGGNAWICPCGNKGTWFGTIGYGFYPCGKDGQFTGREHDSLPWDRKRVACIKCGRIIDQRTRKVVGRKQEDLFADGHSVLRVGSHKTPALSDTMYRDPEIGEETNAYANIPERVEGNILMPSLMDMVPDSLLKKGATKRHFKPLPFKEFARKHFERDMDDEDRYEENVAHFSTLDFPLTIWRAIELEKGQEPNWDKMGVHWTWVENSADTYFGSDSMWSPQDTPKPKNPILAIVKASLNRPDAVDWDSTLVANMVNPDENEVWLESGAQLQLLGVDYDGNGYKKPSIKSIRASTHTKEEGEHIVAVLRNTFPEMDIKLVGSVAAKGVSDKDFDILIMGEGFDEDSWQLLHDTFAGLGWVSQGPTGSRDSETETFSKGGQWLDLWFDEPPSHGKVGSAYPIPSLEDLLQYGGGLNEAQGHWNLITDECRKKEPNWDKLPKEEQEKRLDEEGMKWLARTWKEAEAKLRAFVFPLTVYRAICATEEVKTQNFGIYWAYDENSSYVDKELTGSCDDITIYRGVIPGPDSVDWMRTSWVALVAGDEFEINIRPGSKVGITGVKKHGESQWQESPLKSVTAAAVYLYHGTSETAYQQIMAKGGVMKPGYWGTEAIATYYAEVAAEELGPQEEYAIIKVPLSRFNKSQLIPDSASVAEPITGVLGRSDESLFEEWETSAGTWQDCLRIYGSVSYNASIKITPDSRIAAYAEAQNQSQHTDHTPHGMYKVLKSDPFAEEMALFAPRTNEPEKEEPAEPGATNPGGELRSLLTKSGAGTIMYMQADTRFRASISKGEGVYKTYLSPTEQAAVERGLGFMTKYLTEHPQKGRPAYERSIDIWRVKNVPEKVPESGYFVPGPGDMLLLKTVTVDERTKRQAVEDRTQTRLFAKGVALAHDKKRWMSGGCFLFAKALKERMPDAQYVGLWSEPEESYLHVGVKRGGKYYDIRGEQTEEQFVKPFWNQRHELRGPSEAEIDGGQGYAWKPNPKWPGGNELMSAQATMADAREAVEQAFPSFAANEDSD